MSTALALQAKLFEGWPVRHGFFTRQGGVSEGIYATLNGGVGSRDRAEAVTENRRRMADLLAIEPQNLLVPYQIHSAEAVILEQPFAERPRCDALVTATPGLGLGVTGADCGVVLFADAKAKIIGAAHAGWKGALTGVLEATLDAMESLGGRRERTAAVLGPTIGPQSYEVGPEFYDRFLEAAPEHARFFRPSGKPEHKMFDLPGFIGMRLKQAGIGAFENLGLDTYEQEEFFYSYRRSVHRREEDYGRHVAAIALA